MWLRIRDAVVRISSRTDDGDGVSNLPPLELSLLPLLTMASFVYSAVVFARKKLYTTGILQPTRLPVPVVSIGNITWGGNGKTPMTEFLAWSFLRAGISPVLLTRGYGGGDEAQLLQSHFQGFPATIGIGADRAKIALSILKQHGILSEEKLSCRASNIDIGKDPTYMLPAQQNSGIGVVILDDGMQHLRITRDVEIVMVNALRLFGNKKMIPRGPLREPLSSLKRADVIVVHHADLVSEERLRDIKLHLDRFLVEPQPLYVYTQMTPQCFFRPSSSSAKNSEGRIVPLTAVQGAVVLCISGLGCPESLSLCLAELGASQVERLDYIDHHIFSTQDMLRMEQRIAELKCSTKRLVLAVTSEKDYMRDPAIWKNHDVLVLRSMLRLMDRFGEVGLTAFNAILSNAMRNRPRHLANCGSITSP